MSNVTRRAFVGGAAVSAMALAACGGGSAEQEQASEGGKRKVLRFGMGSLGAPLDMQKNGMSVAGTLASSRRQAAAAESVVTATASTAAVSAVPG